MATVNRIYIKTKGDGGTDAATSDINIGEMALNANTGKLFVGTKLGDVDGTYPGGTPDEASWVGAPILDEDDLVTNSATRLATQQSIKAYVDAAETRAAQGLQVKTNVVGATTGALTVSAASTAQTLIIDDSDSFSSGGITWDDSSNAFTIDGVTLATGTAHRILIKDNVTAGGVNTGTTSCGIYTLPADLTANGTVTLTRATDMNADGEFSNAFVFVSGGADNSDTGWACTVDEGTQTFAAGASGTSITFAQFNSAGTITAGTGLSKTGNTLNISLADTITEAMLDSENAPTNDYVLTADSTAGGGLKWAASGAGDVTGIDAGTNITVSDGNTSTPEVALSTDVDVAGTLDVTGNTTLDADLAVAGGDITLGATAVAGTVKVVNSAISTTGNAFTLTGSDVTAGSGTSNQVGGAINIVGGIGTGTGGGGSIVFKTSAAVGDGTGAGATAAAALTLAADKSATFAGAVSGVTSLAMGGALSGVTTLGVSGLITCDDITAAADAKTLAANASNAGGFQFTPAAITEYNGSSTHALIAGMTVNPFTVNDDATATTTTSALLHLDGLPTGQGTNKYSLWCGGTNGTDVDGAIGGAIISGGTY